jgi:nitrate reductase gamma subunit
MAVQTTGYYAGFVFALAALYLLLRRVMNQGVVMISVASDYLVLLLLLAIAATGLLTRYVAFQDLVYLKHFILGLLAFQPAEATLHPVFIVHFLLVMLLVAYFPFSKLVHAGAAVAFNPTRNQRNVPREARPDPRWDFPID